MTGIFLSYARGDDEQFVSRLSNDLQQRGFDVWFDRTSMPSRNVTFHQELRDAIAHRDRLLLVVGPEAATSVHVAREWQYAWHQADKVVTPVLRSGDYSLVPEELRLFHCEDFRDDERYIFHLDQLIRQLLEPIPPLGKLLEVPALPPHFVSRTGQLEAVRDALLADIVAPVVVDSLSARVGIHGMGGIGKSVIASALAHDRRLRQGFPDGIAWLTVGMAPDPVALLRRLHKMFGGEGSFDSEEDGRLRTSELLGDKVVLLVLDDVWRRSDISAFDPPNSRSRLLITTRDSGLSDSLGGVSVDINLFSEEEALRLLSLKAGIPEAELPREAKDLIFECGHLPLAVALSGALITHMGWRPVLEQLKASRIDRLRDRHATVPRHQSVWDAIHVSVQALEPTERQRFLELKIFPTNEATPEETAATLWGYTSGLDKWDSSVLIVSLAERSLIEISEPDCDPSGRRHFKLHDLVFDYAQDGSPAVQDAHDALVAAYRAQCKGDWATGPGDGYFFRHISRHLCGAGRDDELAQLLLSHRWLETKTAKGYVFELPRDFQLASSVEHGTQSLLYLVSDAIRRDIHFIHRHPTTLFQCMWNTCSWRDKVATSASAGESAASHTADRLLVERLAAWMEAWREAKTQVEPNALWLRSLRPPQASPDRRDTIMSVPFGGNYSAVGASFCTGADRVAVRFRRHYVPAERIVRTWEIATGRELDSSLQPVVGGLEPTTSKDGSQEIVFGGDEGGWGYPIRIVEKSSQRELRQFMCSDDTNIRCAAWARDESMIAAGGYDLEGGELFVWDCASGRERLHVYPNGQIFALAFSRDGSRLYAGSLQGEIEVWDIEDADRVGYRLGHESIVSAIAVSDCGQYILTAADDGVLRVWDAEGLCAHRDDGLRRPISEIAFSPDGSRLVSATDNGTLWLWNGNTGEPIRCLRYSSMIVLQGGPPRQNLHVGQRLIVALNEGQWGTEIGEVVAEASRYRFYGADDRIVSSPNGEQLAVVGRDSAVITIADSATGGNRSVLSGHDGEVTDVSFSADGQLLLTSSTDKTLRLWDLGSGRSVVLSGASAEISCCSLSRDARLAICGCADGHVYIWDIEDRNVMADIEVTGLGIWRSGWNQQEGSWKVRSVLGVAFSASGTKALVRVNSDEIVVWSLPNAQQLNRIPGSADLVALSDDLPYYAVVYDEEIAIFDAREDTPVGWYPSSRSIGHRLQLTAHPSGSCWAGFVSYDLVHFLIQAMQDAS